MPTEPVSLIVDLLDLHHGVAHGVLIFIAVPDNIDQKL